MTIISSGDLPLASVDTYYLIDGQTGMCLDSNASGTVYTWPCQMYDTHEQWYLPGLNYGGGFAKGVATHLTLTDANTVHTSPLSPSNGAASADDAQTGGSRAMKPLSISGPGPGSLLGRRSAPARSAPGKREVRDASFHPG